MAVPVIVTAQLPEVRLQEDGEKETPPEPVAEKLTVPVGEEPVTIVVQVLDCDTATEGGEHETEVPEEGGFTVIEY